MLISNQIHSNVLQLHVLLGGGCGLERTCSEAGELSSPKLPHIS